MTDDDSTYVIDRTIAIEPITIERIEVEIEHSFGFGGLFAVFVVIMACTWIASFDTEIRCSLGSEKACASLKVKP